MSSEAKEALMLYLDKRRQLGHKLDHDSPVIARDGGKPMCVANLKEILRNAFKLFVPKEEKYTSRFPQPLL